MGQTNGGDRRRPVIVRQNTPCDLGHTPLKCAVSLPPSLPTGSWNGGLEAIECHIGCEVTNGVKCLSSANSPFPGSTQ